MIPSTPLMCPSSYQRCMAFLASKAPYVCCIFCMRHSGLEQERDSICSCDLQGMGFSKTKAKEALEECHYRLDMAVEWLVSHCV